MKCNQCNKDVGVGSAVIVIDDELTSDTKKTGITQLVFCSDDCKKTDERVIHQTPLDFIGGW